MVMETIGNVMMGVIVGGTILTCISAVLIWVKDQSKKVTCLRFLIQTIAVFTIFFTLSIMAKWPALVFLGIFLSTLFIGRFFCGWICPFGLYMDIISVIRKTFGVKYWNLPEKTNRQLHKLRYAIVAAVLILTVSVVAIDSEALTSLIYFSGPFKDLTIFFLGPLEPLLKPGTGAIVLNEYSISYPYVRGLMNYTTGIIASIVVVSFIFATVASAFTVRRFWCRFCPTAISISALNKIKQFKRLPLLSIDKVEEKCTKCGVCKRVCPVQVTDVYEQKGGIINTSMCMVCTRCVEVCPYEDCLKVKLANKTVFKSRNWLKPSPIK